MKKEYKRTLEQRANQSARMMGHEVSAETRIKISKSVSKVLIGRPCSAETRAKIGAANSRNLKGRVIPAKQRANMIKGLKKSWAKRKADPEYMAKHCEKLSKSLKGKYTGDKGANWRGGDTQFARKSMVHENWRDEIMIRDDYTCQVCSHRGGALHVDHIKPWSKHPKLRFDPSNGRVVCRPCHYYIHFRRKMPQDSSWGLPKYLLDNNKNIN